MDRFDKSAFSAGKTLLDFNLLELPHVRSHFNKGGNRGKGGGKCKGAGE